MALLAAAVFAIAANLQHRVTRPSGGLAPLALAARILAHPVWLLGLLANFVGFLLHARATFQRPAASFFERIIDGPPALAPLLFPNLVVLGFIALAAMWPSVPAASERP